MGRTSVLMIGLLLATSLGGCIGDGDDENGEVLEPTAAPEAATFPVPDAIEAEESVDVSVDVASFVGAAPVCSMPTAQCFRFPFEIVNTTAISASLSWGVPVNDFDLYVDDGEELVATSGAAPPGTSEGFTQDLEAGSYDLLVVAFLVVGDTFAVNATFAPAA